MFRHGVSAGPRDSGVSVSQPMPARPRVNGSNVLRRRHRNCYRCTLSTALWLPRVFAKWAPDLASQDIVCCMDDSSTSQLRRGVIGPCILALLATGPRYGLQIVRELDAGGQLLTSQGTVYPLLTRLSDAGLIRTAWEAIENGRSRRYYELTPAGIAHLLEFVADWSQFTSRVDALLTRAPDRVAHAAATGDVR